MPPPPMTDPGASLRYFAGGDEVDFREYRRWRQWAINKMNVMDKLPAKARGSFVWTLLQGRALEIVEHLKEEEYISVKEVTQLSSSCWISPGPRKIEVTRWVDTSQRSSPSKPRRAKQCVSGAAELVSALAAATVKLE